MAEVKWIKITTSMFDDEKIDFIESLPEADTILIIWIKLLTLAGKCNATGHIFLTENIPYTEEMLSHKLRRPLNTVKLAIQTFRNLGMIEINDEKHILISNWEKHQNVEGMDKIREQTRKRVAEYRSKQKLLSNSTSNVTVTDSNETDIDKELDKEIDKKLKVADFVSLSEKEHQALIEKLGADETADMIDALNLWKGSKGKKTKSDYLTILNWVRRDEKNKPSVAPKKINKFDYDVALQRHIENGGDPSEFAY